MSLLVDTKALEPTPPRPPHPLPPPPARLTVTVDVDEAHLANPVIAVARMLAAEAGAHAHVDGDDSRIEISVALPADRPGTLDAARAWVRWVVYNAGVRGTIEEVPPTRDDRF
jgi:hypothetical protein